MPTTESGTTEKSRRHVSKPVAGCSSSSQSSGSSSEESLSSQDDSLLTMPPPPDGGYGWVIIFAAFMINLISDGISFSFGILYTELLNYFGTSKSLTSWVGSLFYGICLIGGPLASALATKFGCRKVTIFGGILATVGCFASSFSNNIGMMCFWFGIITGLGMSMGYVTSVVMAAFYFEKKRALATGLSVCGSGIGTFIFAPLTEYLLTLYGWRGTMLIWSGICLHLVVFGALLRPLEFTPKEKKRRLLRQFERLSCSVSCASVPYTVATNSRLASRSGSLDSDDESSDEDNLNHCHSQIQIPTFLQETNVSIPIEVLKESRNNQNVLKEYLKTVGVETSHKSKTQKKSSLVKHRHGEDDVIALEEGENEVKVTTSRERVWKPQNKVNHVRMNSYLPLYRKDIFFRGNLMRLFGPLDHVRSTSCPELYRRTLGDTDSLDDEWDSAFWKYLRFSKHIKRVMKTMFDPAILLHPLYVLFAISNFMLYFWYDVPYIFMADRALEYGISEGQASLLISILGIVNTVGQILYGILGDRAISLTLLYGISLMFCGMSVLLVPLFTTLLPLQVLAGAFGLFISVNYALSTVILVEFLGLDKLSNAYGLTMLIQGIANLVGPPVAALLYDNTGTYDATFLMGGGFIILSGLLLLIVPVARCGRACLYSLARSKSLSSRTVSADNMKDMEKMAMTEDMVDTEFTTVMEKESVV